MNKKNQAHLFHLNMFLPEKGLIGSNCKKEKEIADVYSILRNKL